MDKFEEGLICTDPRTIEEVFKDFKGRRAGILKALTCDVEDFFLQCDPEKDNLCLYGFPDENWKVNLPSDLVPAEIPEPALGINFARDGMVREDWLALAALHSDAWLLAVSFFYAAKLDKNGRKRLFNLINELPTTFDVVTRKKPMEEKTNINNARGIKSKSAGSEQRAIDACLKQSNPPLPPKEEDEALAQDDEYGDGYCGSCGGSYEVAVHEFWIGCDSCGKWFHGKCVKITAARAEHIEHYKCPSCTNKRTRP